jgi:protein-S-isoprenylcysteine O-methyltransferase Ste14
MIKYIVLGLIWAGFVTHWIMGSIPKRKTFEVFAGMGIGICLTLLVFSLSGWFRTDNTALLFRVFRWVGIVFYVSAFVLCVATLVTLKLKGVSESGIENTTHLAEVGLFRIVRHPLYLGLSLWGVGFMFILQNGVSVVLGVSAVVCFWLAGRKEDAFNLRKFGPAYEDYMRRVPMWNVWKGMKDWFHERG